MQLINQHGPAESTSECLETSSAANTFSQHAALSTVLDAIQLVDCLPQGLVQGFARHALQAYCRRVLRADNGDLADAGLQPVAWKAGAAWLLRTLTGRDARYQTIRDVADVAARTRPAAGTLIYRGLLAYAKHVAGAPTQRVRPAAAGVQPRQWQQVAAQIEHGIEIIEAFA